MSNLTLAVSGVSATGQLNSVGAPGLVALTLPVPQLATAGVGAAPSVSTTLPTPVLAIAGVTGVVASVALTLTTPQIAAFAPSASALKLPTPTLKASGFTGGVGSVALTLPVAQLKIGAPNAVALQLPTPTLTSSGRTGLTGSVTLTLPTPTLNAQANIPYTGGVALVQPVPQLAIAGTTGQAVSVAITMRAFALAIEGHTGTIGQVALTLPMSVFTASGYQQGVGSVQLVLPHLQLVASSSLAPAAPVSGAANAIAMHTEQMGVTTYSNFPFNSFAAFNGGFLAASDAGIFSLGGATDNGAVIQAAARVGITDFGTSFLKRVDRVYVGYRTDGNLVLRIFTDEVTQRDYLLAGTGRSGLHGNHARLGKGLVARYWQFEVRNQNGADFDLNMVELKPTPLRRRVGGGDA